MAGVTPASASSGKRERAQEHHVLPAHREKVREPSVTPVVAGERVDRLVLAEDHAAHERRLARWQPALDRVLRAPARRVDGAGDPAPSPPGRLDAGNVKLLGNAAPA